MVLKTDFNHVDNGYIERYKAGEDVSHLPEDVTTGLKNAGHIVGVEAKSEQNPISEMSNDHAEGLQKEMEGLKADKVSLRSEVVRLTTENERLQKDASGIQSLSAENVRLTAENQELKKQAETKDGDGKQKK